MKTISILNCAICESTLDGGGKCSNLKCYNEHEYQLNDDFADFYIDSYIIEYRFSTSSGFENTRIIRRGDMKHAIELAEPLDFSKNSPSEIINRLEKLKMFL